MGKKSWVLILVSVVGIAAVFVACGGGVSTAPITVVKTDDGKVSFSGTIQPILQANCQYCHDAGSKRSTLNLMTYEGVMKGGDMGPAVVPGDPDGSQLVGSVEKTKTPNMPPNLKRFPPLTKDRITAIRSWISEGAENN